MRLSLVIGMVLAVSACELDISTPDTRPAGAVSSPTAQVSARSFVQVVERMEPVAERLCREKTSGANCDFQIVVDTRKGQPPNAYQTVDRSGRPIIAFTVSLIGTARNKDELAFVMGHEAAHHISGHLKRTRESAVAGAVVGGLLATLAGGDASVVGSAQDYGATIGARRYSKDFELEADSLGTVIAFRAGFDPERGAEFFTRIPDPGNRFLGTHPPNASRLAVVRKTLAGLR